MLKRRHFLVQLIFARFLCKIVRFCLFCHTKMVLKEFHVKILHNAFCFTVLLVFAAFQLIKSQDMRYGFYVAMDGPERRARASAHCHELETTLAVFHKDEDLRKFWNYMLFYFRNWKGCSQMFSHYFTFLSLPIHMLFKSRCCDIT